MKVLLTGAAGFIGFHVAKRLLAEGHQVVGVDNLNDYYEQSLKVARLKHLENSDFTFIKSSIEGSELYNTLKDSRFDVVCHLAAQAGVRHSIDAPQDYVSSNLVGFCNILEFCRHSSTRLVFASSSSVYGNRDHMPLRESDPTDSPVSFYGATKKAGEVLAASYASLYGIPTVGLRFFTVYGPWGRPDMAPFLFTRAVLEGRPLRLFNHGAMERDYTYIDDITEGIYRVLTQPVSGFHLYNIGNSRPVRLGDFVSLIERFTGRTAQIEYLPMQPGDVVRTYADTSLLQRDYGYAPATPLEVGLEKFVRWYSEYYSNNSAIANPA
jgi:UDP-glucuronate 4-epimerase